MEDLHTFFSFLFPPLFFARPISARQSGGYLGWRESNNLHLFPLVPRLMKNAFTTCFALTGFSGRFSSLATCHLDWSSWKYDVRVTAPSAGSISYSVMEVSFGRGIQAINKAQGGPLAGTYSRCCVGGKLKPVCRREWIRKTAFFLAKIGIILHLNLEK